MYFGPLDLISSLGIALGEPRLSASYINRSRALIVFNNSSRTDRQFLSLNTLLSTY